MIYYLVIYNIKYKINAKLSLLEFTRVINELFLVKISLFYAILLTLKHIHIVKNKWDSWQLSFF